MNSHLRALLLVVLVALLWLWTVAAAWADFAWDGFSWAQ